MVDRQVVCSGCGQKVEFSSEEFPCQVLNGWLTLSQWKGLGSVEHHNFCCITCLKKWAKARVPEIPKVFLESFNGESGSA